MASTAFLFGFSRWKQFMRKWLPQERIVWGPVQLFSPLFHLFWRFRIALSQQPEVYVWSYKAPQFLIRFCKRKGIPLIRVEDGFIRSVDLGARKTEPLSLCFDRSGHLYFDATGQSDLERILQTHDFAHDKPLLKRARKAIDQLLASRLSKYNISRDADVETLYGPKTRKRILVIGQVDGDRSILLGCDQPIDNNSFVRLVAEKNPDAQIIYKPHPEVITGARTDPPQSNPRDVTDVAEVLTADISLADSFQTIDEVHTITSLAGFEAMLRNIPVHCYGMPFYAGWGATTDRQSCPRRTAKRTVVEIFAAAYLLYPRYLHPIEARPIEFEEALEILHAAKENAART